MLIERENLSRDFAGDGKAERAFRSKIDATLAQARSKNEHFIEVENKCVRIRSPNETEQIKSSVLDWQAFTTVHASKVSTGLIGRPALNTENAHLNDSMSQSDIERYTMLEDVWLAHLGGEDYPDSFSLMPDDVVRSWGKFDSVTEARFLANRRSGLRFRDAEPTMALLLMQ